MNSHKKIILFLSIIFVTLVLFPNNLSATVKDSTALKRKLVISVGYGDPALIYVDNFIRNNYKINGEHKVAPQINPIYAKLEYRLLSHFGIGVNLSYDDYEASQSSSNTNYALAYKGHTFIMDLRLNKHFHLIHQRLDLYLGAGLGYEIQSINKIIVTKDVPKVGNTIAFEATIGARFYFTKRIGIYAEGGIARSIIQGGLVVRL